MKLLLIDGYYYVYRSFFAIRELSNSRGEPTNAIYGFIKGVRKMLRDLQPDLAAVVWDEGLPKRRTELQPEYKQQREEMPEALRPQVAPIHRLMPLMGLANLSLPDTEADDLMATYAYIASQKGKEVVLATNDKDLFQIVNDSIRVYSTLKYDLAAPKDPFALLGTAHVEKKWALPPERIGDYLALLGDSADNIPGVPGMGPKRAAALLQECGSLAQILQNPDCISNLKIREKIVSYREQIIANLEMVRLDLDLPLPHPIDDLVIRPQYPALISELEGFEFRTLTEEVRAEAPQTGAGTQGELF